MNVSGCIEFNGTVADIKAQNDRNVMRERSNVYEGFSATKFLINKWQWWFME